MSCLKQPTKEEVMRLSANIIRAKSKPQEFYDISSEFISKSNWQVAVVELQTINDLELPQEQLAAILSAAKSIYYIFNYEKRLEQQESGEGSSTGSRTNGTSGNVLVAIKKKRTYFISADDFFPIFMYVFVQADVNSPLTLCEYLWNLCDPEQLNGEGGYYLTVFGCALEYLKNADFDELEKK